jgi:hypothetical protein
VTGTTVELTYWDGRTAVLDGWDWVRAALGCGDPLEPAAAVSVVVKPRGEGL